jgi:hypothetical protein
MTVTFYGPWSLTAYCDEGFFTEYFTIAGSDSSDGLYEPADDGSPYSTTVTGEEWTIQFQASLQDDELIDYEPDRGDGFFPSVGRFTVLAPPHVTEPTGTGFVISHTLDVQLTSDDPLLSPPWQKPPDFTIPDGPYGRYAGYLPPRRPRTS